MAKKLFGCLLSLTALLACTDQDIDTSSSSVSLSPHAQQINAALVAGYTSCAEPTDVQWFVGRPGSYIMYEGDQLMVDTGGGQWHRVRYGCVYNFEAEMAMTAVVR